RAHADPAQDPPVTLLALDGVAVARSRFSVRRIPLDALFTDLFETSLERGELLLRVELPPLPTGARATYKKFLPATLDDYATISVAALMDLPVSARCVPGTHDVAADGDRVRGTLDVRVGPVRLALGGTVAIESRDEVAGTARLRADAEDRRVGGAVRALVDLTVTGDAPTELRIASDVAILGRIGELGQALNARQADKV